MTIIRGDYGGMYLRANGTGADYYSLTIHRSGQYSLDVYQNNNDLKSVSNGSSSVFKMGPNQSNLIEVVARGNNFYLYEMQRHSRNGPLTRELSLQRSVIGECCRCCAMKAHLMPGCANRGR